MNLYTVCIFQNFSRIMCGFSENVVDGFDVNIQQESAGVVLGRYGFEWTRAVSDENVSENRDAV